MSEGFPVFFIKRIFGEKRTFLSFLKINWNWNITNVEITAGFKNVRIDQMFCIQLIDNIEL